MKRLNRGIEPIIAVVILVAVTLVIAIGVVGWIMGWWGTFGATESLRIYPDSFINSTSPTRLVLHIKNEGSAPAVIYKVELTGGLTLSTITAPIVTSIGTIATSGTIITVSPGAEGVVTLVLSGTAISGARYQVSIHTRAGNVISATVQAR